MSVRRVLFLHGAEGNPQARKASALRSALGDRLIVPDLSGLDPIERLAIAERSLESLSPDPHLLCGSSLGGWLAAILAERAPARVGSLVLLVPALEPAGWGGETFASFSPEAQALPGTPEVRCRTRVILATRDEIIPPDPIRAWVARTPGAQLEEWDDGHRLANHTAELVALVEAELQALDAGEKSAGA